MARGEGPPLPFTTKLVGPPIPAEQTQPPQSGSTPPELTSDQPQKPEPKRYTHTETRSQSQPDPRAIAIPSENGSPGIGVLFTSDRVGRVVYERGGPHDNRHRVRVFGGPAEVTIIGGEHRIVNGHAQVVTIEGRGVRSIWAYGQNLKIDATELPAKLPIRAIEGAWVVRPTRSQLGAGSTSSSQVSVRENAA